MALREYLDIRFSPNGGLNFDADPLARRGGDFSFAKNIHFLSQFGGTTFNVQPTLGNIEAYTLPQVNAQFKIFRIYIDAITITDTYTLVMSDGNSKVIGTATWGTVPSDPTSTGNNAQAQIAAAVNPVGVVFTSVTVTGATTGYFDMEFGGGTAVPYWDYSVSLTSVGNATPTLPIVIQESIDVSLVGNLQEIGNFDLNGDLILWSTTQTELPSEVAIQGTSNSAGLIRVTAANHGLQSGERVIIKGVTLGGTISEANGSWIVTRIDANNIDLLGSAFIANADANTGVVVVNPQGIGEIGVALKNDNDGTWTYTTLLRTREWNFVTKHQPKTYCERSDILASIYWTDNYNVPRVMYYAGAYMTNGGLSYVNSFGEYEYGTIALETILIRNNNFAHITFETQIQSGGDVPAGNHRYPFRFLTENLTPNLWSDLPNPINVYSPPYPLPTEGIFGSNIGAVTGKINVLTINGIIPNLYKYVEIADIYYVDEIPVGTIIGRFLLTQEPSQTFQHTGHETTVQALDVASLIAIQADIQLALNIDAISNRLVLSNTTSSEIIDFSDFTKTFTHSIKRTETANGNEIVGIGDKLLGTLQFGEYQDPQNVNKKVGYMLNETYRYGAKFNLKNGFVSDVFWIDDIKIDDFLQGGITPFNRGNPFGDNRRILSLPSMDITDIDAKFVYAPYIEFSNINWDFLIDGKTIKSFVDEIIIERVDMTTKNTEVFASGIIVQGWNAGPTMFNLAVYSVDASANLWNGFATGEISPSAGLGMKGFVDYCYATGARFDNPVGTAVVLNPTYPDTNVLNLTDARKLGSFYSIDIIEGKSEWIFASGDQIIALGNPSVSIYSGFLTSYGVGGTTSLYPNYYSSFREFSGYTQNSGTTYNVIESKVVDSTSRTTFNATNFVYCKDYRVEFAVPFGSAQVSTIANPKSPVYYVSTEILGAGVGQNFGVQLAQIYRQKVNKFGDTSTGVYIPTDSSVKYTGASISALDVFGGDVFTQKTWFKHRNALDYTNNSGGAMVFQALGFCGGGGFYSQNRVNSQMINRDDSGLANRYIKNNFSEADWLVPFDPSPFLIAYNNGYDITNGISSDPAFDPNLKRSTKQPARIWYSDIKPENSIVDNYTNFLPLNFKDLQLSFGEITDHRNVNSQLMTLQGLHYELQYFDSTGLLVTNAQEAVLGNAGVMTQRGTALSTYGMDTYYAAIKGKTQGGKDSLAWINTKFGKVMKHDPSQGTTVISDIQFMRSFFNNNLTFAGLYNTPADGKGIHGVWDDINSEFIWTVRAWKEGVQEWSSVPTYGIGTAVVYGTSGFHDFPQFYIAKTVNASQPDISPNDWEAVPLTNYEYYNCYTIAYNEVKNKFTTFYSYMPKIYSKRGKSFLSPRPVSNESIAYEHLRGEYCVWYGDGTTELAEDWSISGMAINEQPNVDKSFKAMMWWTQLVPEKITVSTKNYETFMVDTDCEQRQDQWAVAVKNDSRGTGINDGDTSTVFGTYAEVGISGSPRIFQLFDNFIMKVRAVSRLFNT